MGFDKVSDTILGINGGVGLRDISGLSEFPLERARADITLFAGENCGGE